MESQSYIRYILWSEFRITNISHRHAIINMLYQSD